jgi:outer membrane protein
MMSLRRCTSILLLLVTANGTVYADSFALKASVAYWDFDFAGDVISSVSLDDEFRLNDDAGLIAAVALEHPVPLIPNFRAAYTELSDRAETTLSAGFDFNGEQFTVGQSIDSEIDLTHYDFTAYYQLIDIGMDLDVGATARFFIGEMAVLNVSEDISAWQPMLYVSTKLGLPFSGTYFGGHVNAGQDIVDYEVHVGWETDALIFPAFGVTIGYRSLSIDAGERDFDVDVNLESKGVLVSLTAEL